VRDTANINENSSSGQLPDLYVSTYILATKITFRKKWNTGIRRGTDFILPNKQVNVVIEQTYKILNQKLLRYQMQTSEYQRNVSHVMAGYDYDRYTVQYST
jgi:hypothetical protein